MLRLQKLRQRIDFALHVCTSEKDRTARYKKQIAEWAWARDMTFAYEYCDPDNLVCPGVALSFSKSKPIIKMFIPKEPASDAESCGLGPQDPKLARAINGVGAKEVSEEQQDRLLKNGWEDSLSIAWTQWADESECYCAATEDQLNRLVHELWDEVEKKNEEIRRLNAVIRSQND